MRDERGAEEPLRLLLHVVDLILDAGFLSFCDLHVLHRDSDIGLCLLPAVGQVCAHGGTRGLGEHRRQRGEVLGAQPRRGEVDGHAGQGLGRALTVAGLAHLSAGTDTGMLYVDADNDGILNQADACPDDPGPRSASRRTPSRVR